MKSGKNSSHSAAWLKFFGLLFLLAVGGLIAAYYFGWSWFRTGYRERQLTALATDYYQTYRAQIITDSGLDPALARLVTSRDNGGLFLSLNDLLRGHNGRFMDKYQDRLADCRPTETVVRIIPREPYGAQDFDLELHLHCDSIN
jgi:hypothetical protein